MPKPPFPNWNQGLLTLDWRQGRRASTRKGRWELPLAEALTLGELDAALLQCFEQRPSLSGEGPPSPGHYFPEFRLHSSLQPQGRGWRLQIALHADQRFSLSQVVLRLPLPPDLPEQMFCNGWQSWSESREFHRSERIAPPRWIARKLFEPYGDAAALREIAAYSRSAGARFDGKPGHLHSWSWTCWPLSAGQHAASANAARLPPLNQARRVLFLGSLNEADAYTCFSQHPVESGDPTRVDGGSTPRGGAPFLQISRDVPADWEAKAVAEAVSDARPRPFARTLLDVFWAEGEEPDVYDDWFAAQGIRPRKSNAAASAETTHSPTPPIRGWTSWYRHYNRISAPLLARELEELAEETARPGSGQVGAGQPGAGQAGAGQAAPTEPAWFQIDDGWQPRVGDWLETRPTFPQGLKPLADQARALGFRPGLWLAPFVAEKRSALLREHPEWAERDERGNWVAAGFNPLWSGTFYALNPDHPGLRQHLRRVFDRLLGDWGFDGLKLDFLYAAGLQHREGRSRSARMHSAMAFLREAAGDRWLLGCGVPLAPAFGRVDACRIGADVHLAWEHRLLAFLRNRERVSTRLAALTAVGRRMLDGRAFASDPDVYLMRQGDPAVKLSESEQLTLLLVNRLFGSVLFHSDAPGSYSPATTALLHKVLAPDAVSDVRVLPLPAAVTALPAEQICARFINQGENCMALLNLSNQPWTLRLEQCCGPLQGSAVALWQEALPAITADQLLQLEPHASMVYRLPGPLPGAMTPFARGQALTDPKGRRSGVEEEEKHEKVNPETVHHVPVAADHAEPARAGRVAEIEERLNVVAGAANGRLQGEGQQKHADYDVRGVQPGNEVKVADRSVVAQGFARGGELAPPDKLRH
jgi:alpha-galactosidase